VALLALFDVDGTLFLTHDPLSGEALRKTLSEQYGLSLPADPVARVDHQGQTALRIAREVLRDAGLEQSEIDDGLSAWCGRFGARYLGLLERADTGAWRAAPGAQAALSRLQAAGVRLALLTGNPEVMARARMQRLGLGRFFPTGQGAFGCDAEERTELLRLARARAGDWTAPETVAVGDTPRDVESAHRGGIRAILVRSMRAGEPPPNADAVCDDLDAVATTLLGWAG
jgi:phosphoglycolate phosphatase-like HAD superfamily hydrolase